MPPKIKITAEEILAAAVEIVRERGADALNARALAKALGCSVQPIFRAFSSMEELKSAVYKRVEDIYNKAMEDGMNSGENGFLSMGLTYIRFAEAEKNLFKLLFMTDAFFKGSAMEVAGTTEGDGEVIQMLCSMTGLDDVAAQELYTSIWFTTHGIASLLATSGLKLSDADAERVLSNVFMGMLQVLKDETEAE